MNFDGDEAFERNIVTKRKKTSQKETKIDTFPHKMIAWKSRKN